MLHKFFKGNIFKNISVMMAGMLLAQTISFITAPIITRIYSPDDYGIQSILLTIIGPLTALSSLAFPIAIVVSKSDSDAYLLSKISNISTTLTSIVVTLILMLYALLSQTKENNNYFQWLLFIPILSILTVNNMSATHLMIKEEKFRHYSYLMIISATIGSLSKIIFGYFRPEAVSLIAGNAIGYIVLPLAAKGSWRQPNRTGYLFSDLSTVAHSYRDFALYRAPQNFLSGLSMMLPVAGLTYGYGAAVAGQFAIAVALVGAPVAMIGGAAQSVLFPRLTKALQGEEDIYRQTLWGTYALLLAGAPFFLPVMFFGPLIFEWYLGAPWRDAGVFAAILSPWLWLQLANRPVVAAIPALGLQSGLLKYEMISAGLKFAALTVGAALQSGAVATVGLFSLAGSVSYLGLIYWIIEHLRSRAV